MSKPKQIDLSKCEVGQKVRLRNGITAEYGGRTRNLKARLCHYWQIGGETNSCRSDGHYFAYGPDHAYDIVAILPTQPKKAAKKPKLSRKLVEQTIANLKTILETL